MDRTSARTALLQHTETIHRYEAAAALEKSRQRDRRKVATP